MTFEPMLIGAFKEVKIILDELAIDYWLEAGTLLWFYRNGHIKPGDKDLDLGSHYEEIVDSINDIKDGCQQLGFELQVNDSKITFLRPNVRITVHLFKILENEDPLPFKFFCKGKEVDTESIGYFKKLVFYDKHRKIADILNYLILDGITTFANDLRSISPKNILLDTIKRYLMKLSDSFSAKFYYFIINFGLRFKILKYYELVYPRMFFERLEKRKFYGVEVNIPKLTETYLEYCYGKEWKKPAKNFPRDGYYQIVSSRKNEMI